MKKSLLTSTGALVLAGVLSSSLAYADGPERVPPVRDKVVQAECGACHLTFQPAFLPAKSWKKIMTGLDDHFGEDASLDKDVAQTIEDYLVSNSGRRKWNDSWGKPPIRITKLRWFVKEHRGEISRRAMKKAGTMVNCKACHLEAERGNYDDD